MRHHDDKHNVLASKIHKRTHMLVLYIHKLTLPLSLWCALILIHKGAYSLPPYTHTHTHGHTCAQTCQYLTSPPYLLTQTRRVTRPRPIKGPAPGNLFQPICAAVRVRLIVSCVCNVSAAVIGKSFETLKSLFLFSNHTPTHTTTTTTSLSPLLLSVPPSLTDKFDSASAQSRALFTSTLALPRRSLDGSSPPTPISPLCRFSFKD